MDDSPSSKSKYSKIARAVLYATFAFIITLLSFYKSSVLSEKWAIWVISFILFIIVFFVLFSEIIPREYYADKEAEAILGFVSGLISLLIPNFENKILTMILSPIVSLVIGFLYNCHNKVILNRSESNLIKNNLLHRKVGREVWHQQKTFNDGISVQIDSIRTKIEKLPVFDVLCEIPELTELGRIIRPSLNRDFRKEILRYILKDQIDLLQGESLIMRRDTYLRILKKFNTEYPTLYCINKTLPIYWFSPLPNERGFIAKYADEQLNLNTFRITEVDNSKVLRRQFQDALKIVCMNGERELAGWGLALFYKLLPKYKETKEKESKDGYESDGKERNPLEDVFRGHVLKGLPRKYSEKAIDFFLKDGTYGNDIVKEIDDAFLDEKPRRVEKLASNLQSLIDTENSNLLEILNRSILDKFIEIHGENGAYYARRDYLNKKLPNKLTFSGDGEYGVYLNHHNIPVRSFATIGDFGSLIELIIFDNEQDSQRLYEKIKEILEERVSGENVPKIGNMRYIYEG